MCSISLELLAFSSLKNVMANGYYGIETLYYRHNLKKARPL